MSSEISTALTKRSASTALMAPPPAPKRIKRPSVVLEEDTYTSAVSHIIRRDFFPGLEETDAQREYLDALESKNNKWIREAGNKLTQVMTPVPGRPAGRARGTRFEGVSGGRTPSVWGADTPRTDIEAVEEEEQDDEGLGRLDKKDLDLSLGAFQTKYTSEDQESFNQILDKHNKARFEKNAWLREGNRYASKQRVAQQKVIEARKSDSTDLILRPSQNLDDRQAAPNTHKHSAFNTLMFAPDSIEDWAPTHAQNADAASLAPPKRVLHANTRLPVPEAEPQRPPSPTLSAVRDAIAGRPRLNPSEGGYTGSETPRVNGYAFVEATPPSPEGSDGEAPTDLLERFGAKGSSAVPFTISESQRREKLHHKMVERIASKRNTDTGAQTGTGKGLGIFTSETPRFFSAPTPAQRLQAAATPGGMTPGRKAVGNLTPAAQRLYRQVGGGTPRGDVKGGFGRGSGSGGLGKEWTPSAKTKRKA
jgi:protein DGCR14